MRIKGLILLLLLPLLAFMSYFLCNLFTANFHTVLPGKIYRSAQLPSETLIYLLQKYQFKSVINLRGFHPNETWYQKEVEITQNQGAKHYDVTADAHGLPEVSELRRLVNILQTTPQPILIHCNQGADRSGLASAMALMLLSNPTRRNIEQQISWRYNVLSPSTVGYEVFTNYFIWLHQQHSNFSKTSFLLWLNSNLNLTHHHGFFP